MHAWTLLIVTHVFAALTSVVLGGYQVWRRPKGDGRHRLLGGAWVVLILWTAISSFWVRHINDGAFSWLHVLSVVTLVTVTMGVVAARRGNVPAHRGNMVGSWLGAVGAMAAATMVPVRMVPTYAVAQPGGALAFLAWVLAFTVVLVVVGSRLADVIDRRTERRTDRSTDRRAARGAAGKREEALASEPAGPVVESLSKEVHPRGPRRRKKECQTTS